MDRTLAVVIPGISPARRERIASAAAAKGYRAAFAETAGEAAPVLKEAEIVFSQDSSVCRLAPAAKWICTPSAGVDHFLKPGVLTNPETVLTSSSGAYGVTISEHVVMVTLEMMRRQAEYNEIVRERAWKRDLRIRSIRGSRVTLLGTGDIGQECAKRLRAFGPARLVGVNRQGRNPGGLFDRTETAGRLDAVLEETDLLILSLPATAETRGVMDARRLALLPENAFLVNVGRGSALDQKALEARLREGKLAGAALDVFETEPLPAGDTLWDCPRLLITPHVAGNMTLEYTADRIVDLFLENFDNWTQGRPLARQVDRAAEY